MDTLPAIYARQSIYKEDSISVESQVEYCKYETRGEPYKVYTDKGFSGKDTNRPAFEEMLCDIKHGIISKVIVYKLDRISRSILDFSNMMEVFQRFNVEFISTTEKFDTSTPIGRAMLNICIVFAQLERETIQKRVADTYYSRNKKGLYMGGRVPYGFQVEEAIIKGIKSAKYSPVPGEWEQIKLMYSLYADPENSLGDIIRYFNEHKIQNLRGSTWNTARLSEILRNPIYVRADAEIYKFLKKQGAVIINPIEEFTGVYGCYMYRRADSQKQRNKDLKDKEIVLAPHEGIVSAAEWLKCRKRCLNNRQSAKTCKSKNSWLAGKIKCGYCGYAMTIAKAKTKYERYFVCSAKRSSKKCNGTGSTVYAGILEDYIEKRLKQRLKEFTPVCLREQSVSNLAYNDCKIRLGAVENEIEEYLEKLPKANDILIHYINEKINTLDAKRQNLQEEIKRLTYPAALCSEQDLVRKPEELWEELSYSDKQAVTDIFIKVILIQKDKIEIIWNV